MIEKQTLMQRQDKKEKDFANAQTIHTPVLKMHTVIKPIMKTLHISARDMYTSPQASGLRSDTEVLYKQAGHCATSVEPTTFLKSIS